MHVKVLVRMERVVETSLMQKNHKAPAPQRREQLVQAGDGLEGRAWIGLWSQRIVQCISPFFLLGMLWRARQDSPESAFSQVQSPSSPCFKVLVWFWFAPERLLVCGRCVPLSSSAEGSSGAMV